MNQKIKTFMTGGFTAAVLAAIVITAVTVNQHRLPATTAVQGAQASQQQADDRVTFVATKGKNVLDQLKEHAQITITQSHYGPSVDTVNGQKQDGKYWSYYVNGQKASIGAVDYVTQGGEKIEWKLE
jgi:hypothetical protein